MKKLFYHEDEEARGNEGEFLNPNELIDTHSFAMWNSYISVHWRLKAEAVSSSLCLVAVNLQRLH
jgi:hypothetical protein